MITTACIILGALAAAFGFFWFVGAMFEDATGQRGWGLEACSAVVLTVIGVAAFVYGCWRAWQGFGTLG